MKRKFLLFSALAGMTAAITMSNGAGPAAFSSKNATGSPGSSGTCSQTGCHDNGGAGTTTAQFASITEVPGGGAATSYVAGKTYKIIFSGLNTGSMDRYGLQIVALKNSDNSQAGTFTVLDNQSHRIVPLGNINVFEHKTVLGTATPGAASVTFDWTAPSTASGPITFYGIMNFVNGTGTNQGDKHSPTTQITLSDATSVANIENNIKIVAYPNPVTDRLKLKMENAETGTYTITAFDMMGRTVHTQEVRINSGADEPEIYTGKWAAGTYHIQISKDGAQKVISVAKR